MIISDDNEKKKIHDDYLRNSARFTIKKNGLFFGFPLKDKYVFLGMITLGNMVRLETRQFETPRCHIDSTRAPWTRYK